jgi:hypothetical protein
VLLKLLAEAQKNVLVPPCCEFSLLGKRISTYSSAFDLEVAVHPAIINERLADSMGMYCLYFVTHRFLQGKKKKKVKQSRYTPWRRLGGEEV